MKLHFEPDLDFQLRAVAAVCDLFRGQEVCRTEFTVTRGPAESQGQLANSCKTEIDFYFVKITRRESMASLVQRDMSLKGGRESNEK